MFANAVISEIRNSSSNLSSTFNTIKNSVSASTKNEQIPYSSATSLNFAFNGDELTALKRARAVAEADNTSLASFNLNKSYEKEQAELNIVKFGLAAQSEAAVSRLSQEVMEQREKQKQEDARREQEEAALAAQRSAAENAEIEQRRAEFEQSAALLSGSLKKDSTVEDRIDYIESMKSDLYSLRQVVIKQINDFNQKTDANADARVQEIRNAPLGITEKDSNGLITEQATIRRQRKVDEVNSEAALNKAGYLAEKKQQMAQDDRKWLPQIGRAYEKLEGSTYTVTSLSDVLNVRVGNYDGQTGTWNLHITSELFGYTTLFEEDIPLSYTDVTGKKNTDISKMTDAQMQAYDDDVMVYDSLFRSATPVFYVKLSYKLLRWKEASQYHFIPVKCEIVRLGKKNKTIHTAKANEMNSADFIMYPDVEIRSYEKIQSDTRRAAKVIEAENNAKPKPKTAAYESDYSSASSYYSDSYSSKEDESAKKEKNPSESKKSRGTLYVSGAYVQNDIFNGDAFTEEMAEKYGDLIDTGYEVHLTFRQGTCLFAGISGGMVKFDYGDLYDLASLEIQEKMDKDVYFGKICEGLAINMGSHIRPYVYGGASLYLNPYNFTISDNDQLLGLHAGGGLDIIFAKHLMLTIGADYGWMHWMDSFKNGFYKKTEDGTGVERGDGFLSVLQNPDFHRLEFNVGLGFTW